MLLLPNNVLPCPCGVAHQQQDLYRNALVKELR